MSRILSAYPWQLPETIISSRHPGNRVRARHSIRTISDLYHGRLARQRCCHHHQQRWLILLPSSNSVQHYKSPQLAPPPRVPPPLVNPRPISRTRASITLLRVISRDCRAIRFCSRSRAVAHGFMVLRLVLCRQSELETNKRILQRARYCFVRCYSGPFFCRIPFYAGAKLQRVYVAIFPNPS